MCRKRGETVSWKIINRILGLATADCEFWEAFQKDPLATVQERGFELTAEEQEAFKRANVQTLAEFCQDLLSQLDSTDAG
jgi:hypothetical protein